MLDTLLLQNRISPIVALDLRGRALMTRDMELIRKIFAEIQSRKDALPKPVEIPDVDEEVVARHLEMLLEAALIDGQSSHPLGQAFPNIMVTDLSWAGHDFAAALANDSVWGQMKKKFSASQLKTSRVPSSF